MSPEQEQLLVRVVSVCAVLSAVVVAASVVLAALFFGRKRHDLCWTLAGFGSLLGIGIAFYLGCRMLGLLPRWKLGEVDSRFLYVLFPAILFVETAAAIAKAPRWIAWVLRILIAAATPSILLHGSVYLLDTDSSSPAWTPLQAYGFLGGLSAALLTVWAALAFLAHWTKDRVVPLAVAGTCAGAAVTVMYSGYLAGGELGLPLAAALAGAAIVALVLRGQGADVLGVGIVGLFGVLALGLFFSKLAILHAILLFAAPLLCWLPEFPLVRRLWPWVRGALRIALVMSVVAVVTAQAQRQFAEDSKSPSHFDEPTTEDYLNFKP